MTTALIIGSGAAAAGVALALKEREDVEITVLDIGLQLEPERRELVETLAAAAPGEWSTQTREYLSQQPVASGSRGVPEKRVFGSNYPFRDAGQLAGLTAVKGANSSVVSSAYGGFSNVWGSQLMPFTDETFQSWPFKAAALRPHYEAVLGQIPFAGEEDDLAANFPLMRSPVPLPELAARSQRTLDAYARHRAGLNRRGVTFGKARLAFQPRACVRCGLCMTGCPYGLIYSAAQTFDELRRAGRITYHGGLLALEITEEAGQSVVTARELASGQLQRFPADRVYVACGAMGTTRLVAKSLGLLDVDIDMQESRQFILPFLSLRPVPDPRGADDFTLNQFNAIVAPDGGSLDVSTLHFYAYNQAFADALPFPLQTGAAEPLRAQLLRRLSVAFGYLPSWHSPRIKVRVGSRPGGPDFPDFHISSGSAPAGQREMLTAILRRLAAAGPRLDLYPVVPMLRLAPVAKSYHWGSSFPHAQSGYDRFHSDTLGRVGTWQRTHLVDASVFPAVPATTYGLTVMANAHRIATESMALSS